MTYPKPTIAFFLDQGLCKHMRVNVWFNLWAVNGRALDRRTMTKTTPGGQIIFFGSVYNNLYLPNLYSIFFWFGIIYIYLIYILIIFFYACGFNFLWPLEIKLWPYCDLGSSPHHQQLNELSWFHILFLCLWISIGPDRIRIWSYLPSYLRLV